MFLLTEELVDEDVVLALAALGEEAVLLDEVQLLDRFEEVLIDLKSMPGVDVYVTGSTGHLPQKTDGMDVSPLFYGKDIDTDSRDLYWEFPGKQRAVRHGQWKAVTVKKGAPLELYRIKEDPCEQNNLAEKYPDVVRELDKLMWSLRTPSANYPIEGDKWNVRH